MRVCAKYHIQKIYVVIPSASSEAKKDILNICNQTGCELLNLPGMYQLYTGDVTVSNMKEVAVEDLLGRDPIKVNMDEIFQHLKEKPLWSPVEADLLDQSFVAKLQPMNRNN